MLAYPRPRQQVASVSDEISPQRELMGDLAISGRGGDRLFC